MTVPGHKPVADEIRAARLAIPNLTQTEAAALIFCSLKTWQQWESGIRQMHPAFWELWRIKSKRLAPR